MEHTLRCNSLKCRQELNDKAVVTTCSHVFCIECASQHQLHADNLQHRVCPACRTGLTQQDDAALTNLNPAEDYRTSVLSGLSPNIIMECAGRALSFWTYQTTQEIVYQEYLAKNLTSKFATLSNQIDTIINDANAEIGNLRNKLNNMHLEQENLRRKNDELAMINREKGKKLLQAQELYDKSKKRDQLHLVQNAACDAVEQTIQASVAAGRFVDKTGNDSQRMPPPPVPIFRQQNPTGIQGLSSLPNGAGHSDAQANRPAGGDGQWSGYSSQGSQSVPPILTLSTNRQRFGGGNTPTPRVGLNQSQNSFADPMQRLSPRRRALSNISGNLGPSGFSGYGMSAGLKSSNPASGGLNSSARPRHTPRVAQRPASTGSNDNPAFRGANPQNMFSSNGHGGGYY